MRLTRRRPFRHAYQRAIVQYHRKEAPGSIVIDTDARYLYYVLPEGRAIRYGVIVGEDALSWYGIAKVGRKEEWPSWTPTEDEQEAARPASRITSKAARTIRWAPAAFTSIPGQQDTLYRIHGTNQPEYIGQAISSGCIRMTNEDVIDLYNRVKMGAIVVVLAPKSGDSPVNPQVASADPALQLRASRGLGAASGASPAPFHFEVAHACISRSRFAQSRVRSSARPRRSNSSSISAGAMISGGQIDTISPTMKRTISPSSSAKRTARGPTPAFASNERLVALSATSSTRADEPEAARLADQRVLAERGQPGLEMRRLARRLLGDALARIDVERLERHRRRDRMARIGEAVAEGADLAALIEHRLVHRLRHRQAPPSARRPRSGPWRP